MLIFGASTAIMSLQPLVLHLADQRSSADERMGPAGFMLTVEVLKIALCAGVVLGRRALGLESSVWCGWRHTLRFAVPAAIYLVMNIMKVFAARAISPPVFQLLASTKILATAVASWALLNKHLTPKQWAAMLLLTVGVALGQHRGSSLGEAVAEDVPFLPTVVMFLNSGFSAFGAVYTERVLKASQSAMLSTFATNLHMSAHTLLMNSAKAFLWEATELPRPWNFGFWTWFALINEAVNGLCVSALMRHADSIVKNYAFGASIFATAALSVPLLSYWPQLPFFAGAVLVLMSMYLYARGALCNVPSSTASNGNGLHHSIGTNGHGMNNGTHDSNGTNGHAMTNGKHPSDGSNGNGLKNGKHA